MGLTSRNKGKAGERELARLLADLTGFDVRRRVRQHDRDSDLEGVPGWSIEAKRLRAVIPSEVREHWNQAEDQAGDLLPVLFIRCDRRAWSARWPLSCVLVGPSASWRSFEWTVESSLEAWAAVVREVLAGPGRGG